MESVEKVAEGIKGDPTRPLGEKPTKVRRIFQRRRWGPGMQAGATKMAAQADYWQRQSERTKEEERIELGRIELEWVELELGWGWSVLNMERQEPERVRVEWIGLE